MTISAQNQTGQIVAFKLDQSGTAEHFGHHFSSSMSYDKVPMGVPSPDGNMMMFKSDFGDADNADLAYCFEVKVSNTSGNKDVSEEINTYFSDSKKRLHHHKCTI